MILDGWAQLGRWMEAMKQTQIVKPKGSTKEPEPIDQRSPSGKPMPN